VPVRAGEPSVGTGRSIWWGYRWEYQCWYRRKYLVLVQEEVPNVGQAKSLVGVLYRREKMLKVKAGVPGASTVGIT
jgi:hypothetical protein